MIFQLNQAVNAYEIPQDKLMHIGAGAGIYAGMTVLEYYNIYHFENKLLLVFLAGLSKEIHDSLYETHTACPWDVIATTAGGFIMYTLEY